MKSGEDKRFTHFKALCIFVTEKNFIAIILSDSITFFSIAKVIFLDSPESLQVIDLGVMLYLVMLDF